jgi:hypothetical protein
MNWHGRASDIIRNDVGCVVSIILAIALFLICYGMAGWIAERMAR